MILGLTLVMIFLCSGAHGEENVRLLLSGPFIVGSSPQLDNKIVLQKSREFSIEYNKGISDALWLGGGVSRFDINYSCRDVDEIQNCNAELFSMFFKVARKSELVKSWHFEIAAKLGYGQGTFKFSNSGHVRYSSYHIAGEVNFEYSFTEQIELYLNTGGRRFVVSDIKISDDKKITDSDFYNFDLYHAVGVGYSF